MLSKYVLDALDPDFWSQVTLYFDGLKDSHASLIILLCRLKTREKLLLRDHSLTEQFKVTDEPNLTGLCPPTNTNFKESL